MSTEYFDAATRCRELEAEVARLKGVIKSAYEAICPPDTTKDGRCISHHARHNLEGAYADLEAQKADPLCLQTIDKVAARLAAAENALESATVT